MNNWVEKQLGEVCTLQRGFDLPKRLRTQGKYPLLSSSGFIDSHKEAKVSGPGVVTGRSGSIGSIFFINEDFWPLNTTLYVKNFHGNDPQYIFYLLKNFDLKRFASGAGVPTLNRNSVHTERVRITTNISEQKRIVAIVDEVFAGIDTAIANTEKNLANAHELFENYLNAIVTQTDDSWVQTTIGDVCKLSQGLAINKKTKFLLVPKSNLPLLRIKDLRNNTAEQFVAEKGYPINSLVVPDDIIYTRTGNSLGLVFTGRKGILHNNSFKINLIHLETWSFIHILFRLFYVRFQ